MKPSRIPQMRKKNPSGDDATPRALPRNAVVLVHDEQPGTLDVRRVRLLAIMTTGLIGIIAAFITFDPLHLVHYTKWPTRNATVIAQASTSVTTPVTQTPTSVAPPTAPLSAPQPAASPHVGYAAPPAQASSTATHPARAPLPPQAAASWSTLVRQAQAAGIPLEYRDTHLNAEHREALALTDTGRLAAHPVVSVEVISDAGARWLEDHGLPASWCPDPFYDDHHFTLWRAGGYQDDDNTELHLLQCPIP